MPSGCDLSRSSAPLPPWDNSMLSVSYSLDRDRDVSRARVGVGLVTVALGTVWALGGVSSVASSSRKLAELLSLVLVLGGVSAILLIAVPRGTLAGPVLLIVVGLLGFAAEHGMFHRSFFTRLPAVVLIGAGAIVAMSRSHNIPADTGVERFTAVALPVRRSISGVVSPKLIIRAIFTLLKLDLSQANFPPATRLWIDITCVLGRVEIILPQGWEVQAGRIELARRITFGGTLTRSNLAPPSESEDQPGQLVVINVLGWGGAVMVERR